MTQTPQRNRPRKLLVCTQVVDRDHPILGFFVAWLRAFAEDFDRIDVICLEKGEYDLPAHVQVHSLEKETGAGKLRLLVRFYRHFWRIYMHQGVDYVFFHMGAIYNILAAPFFLVRRLKQTKFYWWKAHGHINLMGRLALWFVDRVYTSTPSGFPVQTAKRHIVGQAIDTALFGCDRERRKKRVIFVGRVMPVKHLEVFIDAARRLRERHPDCTFAVIGPISDEAYQTELTQRALAAGLDDTIFLGPMQQAALVDEYCRSTIFLNPSLTHSMDKTVLEAVLCGCVPLTANRAFAELLQPVGLYNKEQSVNWYVKRVDELLQNDLGDLRERLVKQVRSRHSLATFSNRIFG